MEDDPLTISVVTPTGGLRVDGSIDGITMSFLVDTRAEDTWDDLHNESTVGLQTWTGNPLVSVDGTSLH